MKKIDSINRTLLPKNEETFKDSTFHYALCLHWTTDRTVYYTKYPYKECALICTPTNFSYTYAGRPAHGIGLSRLLFMRAALRNGPLGQIMQISTFLWCPPRVPDQRSAQGPDGIYGTLRLPHNERIIFPPIFVYIFQSHTYTQNTVHTRWCANILLTINPNRVLLAGPSMRTHIYQ